MHGQVPQNHTARTCIGVRTSPQLPRPPLPAQILTRSTRPWLLPDSLSLPPADLTTLLTDKGQCPQRVLMVSTLGPWWGQKHAGVVLPPMAQAGPHSMFLPLCNHEKLQREASSPMCEARKVRSPLPALVPVPRSSLPCIPTPTKPTAPGKKFGSRYQFLVCSDF